MNNIYNDVSVLVKKLKDSNYTDLSTNLEHKLNVYKFAEKHLYNVFDEEGKDIIEFAHRDGDADMVDASGDLGMVETPLSVHEKVEKVFYKKPTGKYAEIETVVKMAAEALGIDLIKNAQDANQDTTNPMEDVDETGLSATDKNKIIIINKEIDKTQKKINNIINSIIASFNGNFQFTENLIFNNGKIQDLFNTYSGLQLEPDYFNKIKSNKNTLISLGLISEEKKASSLKNNLIKESVIVNPYTAYRAYKAIDPDKVHELNAPNLSLDEYRQNQIIKMKNTISKLGDSFLPKKDHFEASGLSAIKEIDSNESFDISKLPKNYIEIYNTYITSIKDFFMKEYNQVINAIPKANESLATAIKEEQDAILSDINTHNVFQIAKINFQQPTIADPIGNIIYSRKYLPEIQKKINENIQSIYDAFTSATNAYIDNYFISLNKLLNDLENNIKQAHFDPVLDVPLMANIYTNSLINFRKALVTANNQLKIKTTPPDFVKVLTDIRSASSKAINAINLINHSSKDNANNYTPYGVIYTALPPDFDILTSAQTQEGLLAVSQKLNEYTNTVIAAIPKQKTSNLKSDIIKIAQVPAWSGNTPKATPKNTTQPGKTNKQPTIVQGLGKANLEDPAENAVAHMQLALNNFGRMISVDSTADKFPNYKDFKTQDGLSILSTGPKSNPSLNTFDGKWSTNTNNALSIADKYVESLGLNLILGIRWDPKAKTHAGDTQTAANKNTEVLNRINSYLAGTSPRPSSNIFDELPNTINWDIQEGPAEASLGKSWWGGKQQGIPVTRKDLSTLQSLYDFLIANNLRTPESSGQSETEIGMEGFAPSTWNETLQWFIRRAVLKYNSGSAENKNSAREYYAMVKKLFDQYKKIITYYGKKLSPGQVINPALIYQVSRNYGYSGSMQSGQFGNQFGQDPLSGFDFSRPSSGFGKQKGMKGMEGFKSSLFGEDEESEGVPFDNTIDFRHSSWSDFDASQLATPRLHLRDFFRINGKRMADTLFAGAQYPETSLNLYRKFLNNLQTKLHQVINQWVSETDAPGELIDNLQKFYNEWQRGIIKQKEDLARK